MLSYYKPKPSNLSDNMFGNHSNFIIGGKEVLLDLIYKQLKFSS